MAPTPDELVQALQGTVDKLENRVAELEARLKGQPTSGRSASSGGDGLRMILIGPPGAGELPDYCLVGLREELGADMLCSQARARKHHGSRRSTPAAI